MQIRFLFLFHCLLATSLLSANNGLEFGFTIHPNEKTTLTCELPPPSDFHVLEQGPTSVTFEFTPFLDAAPSRIKTYRTSDGLLLDNRVIPAGITKAMIDNLPVNTNLYATINSLCEDGSDGPVSMALPTHTLILEIIVAGFQPGTEPSCTIKSAPGQCEFDGTGIMTPFRIYNSNQSRQFGVRCSESYLQVSLEQSGNANQSFKFYCDAGVNPPCTDTKQVFVTYESIWGGGAISVARFELTKNFTTTVGYFNCTWLAPNYKIERMGPGPNWQRPANPNTGDREAFTPSEYWASAAPNPFSNNLDVYLGENDAQAIQLQLYNLAGQKVLDQQFSGGQEQYSLSTASLSPGFYMLRIEADGNVQTLKVIKSE